MSSYERFSASSSPPPASSNNPPRSHRRFSFQDSPPSTSDSLLDEPHSTLLQQQQQQALRTDAGSGAGWRAWLALPQAWQQRWRHTMPSTPRGGGGGQQQYQSNYMTLVPLSDDRLKPRRTKLIVGSVLLLALLAIAGVFVLVPRGVSVGTIDVHSTKMTFNSTTKTYRIILQADVPVYNNNYLQASVTGNLTVSFYDAEAGWGALGPVMLAARTNPQVLSVNVDASNLPRRYTRVVYDQCFNFPRILVFFLLGTVHTRYLGYRASLPPVDTYFLLDCSGVSQDDDGDYVGGSSRLLPAQLEQLPPAVQARLQSQLTSQVSHESARWQRQRQPQRVAHKQQQQQRWLGRGT